MWDTDSSTRPVNAKGKKSKKGPGGGEEGLGAIARDVPKLKPMGVSKLTPAGLPVMENVCEKDLGEFFGRVVP